MARPCRWPRGGVVHPASDGSRSPCGHNGFKTAADGGRERSAGGPVRARRSIAAASRAAVSGGWEAAVTSSIAEVWSHRNALRLLVRRDLAVKYQQSVLGYIWSLLEPLELGRIS